ERDSHFVAGAGVANHGTDLVDRSIQRVHVSDGDGFFAGSQPRRRQNSLLHPSAESDVVKPKTEEARIHVNQLFLADVCDNSSAVGIALEGIFEFVDDAGLGFPVYVLRWIEHRIALHTASVLWEIVL